MPFSQEDFENSLRNIIRDELNKQEPTHTEQRYLTRDEVCDLLKISLPTLHRYTKRGILPARKIGTRVLYAETDLINAGKS